MVETWERLFDPDDFHAWLDKFQPGTAVGQRGNGRCCPFATWLSWQGYDAEVDANVVCIEIFEFQDPVERAPPPWLRRFIEIIDHPHSIPETVTREQAIAALAAARAEAGEP